MSKTAKSAIAEIGLFPVPEEIDMDANPAPFYAHIDSMLDKVEELNESGYDDVGDWLNESAEALIHATVGAWIAHDVSVDPELPINDEVIDARTEQVKFLVSMRMLGWLARRYAA